MIIIWIILGVLVLTGITIWSIYNSLIKLKIKVDEALSDITVQMKRRFDLIPNLINTVKGYAKHEKEVLENVTKARTAAMGAEGKDLRKSAEADNMLSSTLKSLFAVAENYPDLKADSSFLKLQEELTDTEDKIQASRRFYNSNVTVFNTKLQVFPTNIIGKRLGFTPREFFDVEGGEKASISKAPEAKF